MNINTKEYWDNRFSTNDWSDKNGRKQTEFFVNMAVENFPKWFIDEVNTEKLSLCDFGCAEGEGVKLLKECFRDSRVVGMDISDEAIKHCKKNYPDNEFIIGTAESITEDFDVIFSSNTFEHFENPFEVLDKLMKHTRKYCVLLLPFREFERIDEHLYTFNFDSFPMKINDFFMVSAVYIESDKIENSYWYGKQILIVYANINQVQIEKIKLDSIFYNNIEILNKDINLLLKDKDVLYKKANDSLQKVYELNKVLEEKEIEIKNYRDEIDSIYNTKMWQIITKYKKMCEKYAVLDYIRRFAYSIVVHGIRKTASKILKKAMNKVCGKTCGIFNRNKMGNNKRKKNQNKERKIYIFATVPYYDIGGGQRSAQLAKTFHKMGYDVTYLFAYDSSDAGIKDIYIPCEEHYDVKHYSPEFLKSVNKEIIMIFEAPHMDFLPYLKTAKTIGAKTVYEHIDNWETSLGDMFFNKELFICFLKDSDVIVATAELLKDKIVKCIRDNDILKDCEKKVHYIPNAVDSELFDPAFPRERPADLVEGEKTLLYYGSLYGEWLDWELIRYIAKNYNNCSINIIGDYEPIIGKIDCIEKNIHFLGMKKQSELPGYLSYSDIALLPFKCDEIGIYVSPLKIFEYISMGKRVLSTELPDIEGYPNVFASNKKEDWLEYVKSEAELKPTYDFVSKNNWFYCCNRILDNISNSRPEHGKISVIILNRNNKSIISKCVESLIINKGTYNYEIVVVDNDSTDGSYEMLQKNFGTKIKLLRNNENGCSSGRNLGVKNTECDIIVFLDSDQWSISERWLDVALYILNNDMKIGAVGWGAGWFEKGRVTGKIVDYLPNRGIDEKTLYRNDIAYLATSGMVVRREIFDAVNGFDNFYDPTCFEDTDLSLAIRNAGYETVYCPFININHLPHQTTKSGSSKHTELMKRNGDYFWNKWNNINSKLLKYYFR